MKILILLIITTWSFNGGYQNDYVQKRIVDSEYEASCAVFTDKYYNDKQIEPDHKLYKLYSVDFKTNKITEVELPEIRFVTTQDLKEPKE